MKLIHFLRLGPLLFLAIPGSAYALPHHVPESNKSSGFETIIAVQDLPNIPALRRTDGSYIDLGYKFSPLTGNEWVGYVGSSTKFLELDQFRLGLIMKAAGLNHLPPTPSKPNINAKGTGL